MGARLLWRAPKDVRGIVSYEAPRTVFGACFRGRNALSSVPPGGALSHFNCLRIPVAMILPVLQYPDPRLAIKAKPVGEITPEIRELVDNMVETMYARDGIGLAAPQVGVPLRLVVMDTSGPERREALRVLINPVLSLSGEVIDSDEGCLSVEGYSSVVKRRENAHVEAIDQNGAPVVFDAGGRLAVCCQHECDHLDGVLFIDHISRLKRTMLDRKIQKRVR